MPVVISNSESVVGNPDNVRSFAEMKGNFPVGDPLRIGLFFG